MIKKMLNISRGFEVADLVLKNVGLINVFTEKIEYADIAICGDTIVGIGTYEGITEIDCLGKFASPGFIDGHIHLESSMLKPIEFSKVVLPHGTTAVITDPHEIANVCGIEGIKYMMAASKDLPLDTYFVLPSCVPSTDFDENGTALLAKDLVQLYEEEKVLGLAEVMNYIGTIQGNHDILEKIADAKRKHKIVDGHAPGLHGKDICAYVLAGVQSDHECSHIDEAIEKISKGQWIMIREGTAAKNMNALMDLFLPPLHQRAMLVTDDKHPYDLITYGHIDDMLRLAVANGADPCIAIKMATYNTATYFGIQNVGAIAPGYKADIVIISDLKDIHVEKVIKNGKLVFDGKIVTDINVPVIKEELIRKIHHSFHCNEIHPDDFCIHETYDAKKSTTFQVIQLIKGEILTKELRVPLSNLLPDVSLKDDILKIAVIERHHNTGHIGLGFVNGFGLNAGAIASSVSHDSHNLIVIGTNDADMSAAANCIKEMGGGWAIALDGEIIGRLPLPIAGLISELDAVTLSDQIKEMMEIARKLGVFEGVDPFMTLAFISLPVIPELRLTTLGLFDTRSQSLVPLIL